MFHVKQNCKNGFATDLLPFCDQFATLQAEFFVL